MSNRIAIYGGAFNPPHLAHLFVIQYLLTHEEIDQVWVMPSARHAFGKHMAPFMARCQMLQHVLEGYTQVSISRFEYENKNLSGRTYDTLDALSTRYPHCDFTLVIGADNLTESHRWHRFNDLIQRWQLIVLGRPGHEDSFRLIEHLPQHHRGPTLPSISSSELRDVLAKYTSGSALEASDQALLRWLPQKCKSLALHHYSSDQVKLQQIQQPELQVPQKTELQVQQQPKHDCPDIWIWGSGKVGQTLYAALTQANYTVGMQSLRALSWIKDIDSSHGNHSKSNSAKIEHSSLTSTQQTALNSHEIHSTFPLQALRAKTWIIACRDQQISTCVQILSHYLHSIQSDSIATSSQIQKPISSHSPKAHPSSTLLQTQTVFHCSGVISYHHLQPLQACGLSIAQCHPLQSLRGANSVSRLKGCAFYIQGDQIAVQQATRYVNDLQAWVLSASSNDLHDRDGAEQFLAIYHAAAVCAGNLPLMWIEIGSKLLQHLGFTPLQSLQALTPLAQASTRYLDELKQALDDHTSPQSSSPQTDLPLSVIQGITGPLTRKDVASIQSHIHALSRQEVAHDIQVAYQSFVYLAARLCQWSSQDLDHLRTSCHLLSHNFTK